MRKSLRACSSLVRLCQFPGQEYWRGCRFFLQGTVPTGMKPMSPVSLASSGRFFTADPPGKPLRSPRPKLKNPPWFTDCLYLYLHSLVRGGFENLELYLKINLTIKKKKKKRLYGNKRNESQASESTGLSHKSDQNHCTIIFGSRL